MTVYYQKLSLLLSLCANLVLKTLATKVLKSGVVTYLSWLWSVIYDQGYDLFQAHWFLRHS